MPERMPDRMPEKTDRIECQIISEHMPERMSEIVRVCMPYVLPDGVSETFSR